MASHEAKSRLFPRKQVPAPATNSCSRAFLLFHFAIHQPEERIMAKGAMKAGKEARKPKKDAKKPAAAPPIKAAPVKAMRIKEK
jgi:hypothetical protein